MHAQVLGHVQTIFGKINVIMTLRGGSCDANFFCLCIAFFLLAITPRLCCNYANYIARTGHFIANLTLYQMLESAKNTSLN